MPAAKKGKLIAVILPNSQPKKSSVRFDGAENGAQVTNIYLGRQGFQELGSPTKVKVTVEAYSDDE